LTQGGITPGAGARRSRRGYFYQDAYTARCCLEMVNGRWEVVEPEADEDVLCRSAESDETRFIQVKTVEGPPRLWTVAELCRPQSAGHPETSMLGRLLTGKEIPDNGVLVFATNERVAPELRPLTAADGSSRESVEAELADRLEGVEPSNRELEWCLRRLLIEECENTADGLEAQLHRDLGLIALSRGFALLPNEVSSLLEHVLAFVQERSREPGPTPISRHSFESLLDTWADQIQSHTDLSVVSPDEGLRPKLLATGMTKDEIRKCEEMRFRFSRRRRSAVGDERVALDDLVDEIAMACLDIRARRNAGDVSPGLASVQATLAAVADLFDVRGWGDSGVSLATALGALHDVTGRCQNRYVDE
jgi:hypothetical protein